MRILLTGASGLLGAAVAETAGSQGHEVTGTVHGFAGPVPGLTEQVTMDLADGDAAVALIRRIRPDAIVNCAAISSIPQCEADPIRSRRINVDMPALLAVQARQLGARLVHVSSEQVFDGRRSVPCTPADPVNPITRYGSQKVDSERAIHSLAPEDTVTVRPPLLLGNSLTGRRGLHEQLFAAWRAAATPELFSDEFRQPCSVPNLAAVLLELCARRELTGIFHWAGTELVSRHVLASRIRDHFKLPPEAAPLAGQTRSATPEVTRSRPACLAIDISSLAARVSTRPQSLLEQFAGFRVPAACAEWYDRHRPR